MAVPHALRGASFNNFNYAVTQDINGIPGISAYRIYKHNRGYTVAYLNDDQDAWFINPSTTAHGTRHGRPQVEANLFNVLGSMRGTYNDITKQFTSNGGRVLTPDTNNIYRTPRGHTYLVALDRGSTTNATAVRIDLTGATTVTKHTSSTDTPTCWDLASRAMDALNRVILYGPPGTGKTYFGLNHKPDDSPSYRLICSDDMTNAQVEGCFMPNASGTWNYHEGPAVLAWRNGGRLVIDEVDKAGGDVMSMLLAFTDSVDSSEWLNPETGDKVTPHKNFSVVMSTNLTRMAELPAALKDRFPVAINITEPHPMALQRLPEDLRESARVLANADEDRRQSMRAFQAVADLMAAGWERTDALNLVMPTVAASINDAIIINEGAN